MPLVCVRLPEWRDAGKSEIRAQTFHRPAGFSCLKPWSVYVSCLVTGLGHNAARVWKKEKRQSLETPLCSHW